MLISYVSTGGPRVPPRARHRHLCPTHHIPPSAGNSQSPMGPSLEPNPTFTTSVAPHTSARRDLHRDQAYGGDGDESPADFLAAASLLCRRQPLKSPGALGELDGLLQVQKQLWGDAALGGRTSLAHPWGAATGGHLLLRAGHRAFSSSPGGRDQGENKSKREAKHAEKGRAG